MWDFVIQRIKFFWLYENTHLYINIFYVQNMYVYLILKHALFICMGLYIVYIYMKMYYALSQKQFFLIFWR